MKFKLLSTPFSICMIVLSPICSCTWDLLICPDWFSHLVLMQIAIMCHLQVCLIIILRHHVNLSSVICSSCSVSRISHHIHTPPTIVYCIYMTPNFRSIRHFSSCLYAAEHQVCMLSVIMVICYPWFLYAALSSGQYDVRHQVYVPPVFMSLGCASSFQYDSCHYGYKWPLISSICHP